MVLGGVSEPRHVICKLALLQHLLFGQFLVAYFPCNFFSAGVLQPTPCGHEEGQTKCNTRQVRNGLVSIDWSGLRDDGNQEAVAFDVAGSVAADVDVGCDDPAAVAAHDLVYSQ